MKSNAHTFILGPDDLQEALCDYVHKTFGFVVTNLKEFVVHDSNVVTIHAEAEAL